MDTLESVYDAEIAPLMAQIIAICNQHDMPFVASFQLRTGEEEEGTLLFCTSMNNPEGCEERIGAMGLLAQRGVLAAWLSYMKKAGLAPIRVGRAS